MLRSGYPVVRACARLLGTEFSVFDLLAYAVTARRPGDRVAVTVWRDGKTLEFTLPMQE